MALKTGELKSDANEGIILDEGMSKEIYMKLNYHLSPPLQEAVDEAKEALDKAKLEEKEGKEKAVVAAQDALDKARLGWKKLAYSISYGVIEHIKSNMEIKDIETTGDVTIDVSGKTGMDILESHDHRVSISSSTYNILFKQTNSGTGLVQ